MKKDIRKWEALLTACILAAMLCACASPEAKKTEGKQGGEQKTQEQKEEQKEEGPVIEEQAVYEENGIRITAKELKIMEDTDYPSGSLTLLMENEGTEDIMYEVNAVLINHYEMDKYYGGQKIQAGKKANIQLSFDENLMKKAGYKINEVGEVEVEFKLGKESQEIAEFSSTGLLSVKTSDYDSVKSRPLEGGREIYNEAGIRISYLGLSEPLEEYNGYYGFGADMFIENTSDRPVVCWIIGKSVDGKVAESYHSFHVSAGRMAGASVDFLKEDIGDMEIGSVGEITVTIHLNSEEYMSEEGYATSDMIADYKDVTFSAQ